MFLICIIPKDYFKYPKTKKTLIISYIIAALSLFIIIFQTIATFGYELTKLYEYPEFFVLKHINISSRVESILIIQLIFDMFIYSALSIYFIGISLKNIFNFKKLNLIYFIICLLTVIGTTYISKYNFYLDKIIYNYVPIIFNIFISCLIIIICLKIKTDKHNLSVNNKEHNKSSNY